jgi:hypothetical protein
MNRGFQPGVPMTVTGIVSVANICLMVIAAFYRGRASTEATDTSWRVRLGLIAVCFGLCSQVLYCLMQFALIHDWVPFYSGNSHNHLEGRLTDVGLLLSAATFFFAMSAGGLRRYSGLWVAVTNWYLWSLSGLGALLRSRFW